MAETTPVAKQPTMEEMRRLVQEDDQKVQRAAFEEAMTKYIPIAKFMEQPATTKFQKDIEDLSKTVDMNDPDLLVLGQMLFNIGQCITNLKTNINLKAPGIKEYMQETPIATP